MLLVTRDLATSEPSERSLDGGAAGEVAYIVGPDSAVTSSTVAIFTLAHTSGRGPAIVREQNVGSQDAWRELGGNGVDIKDPSSHRLPSTVWLARVEEAPPPVY